MSYYWGVTFSSHNALGGQWNVCIPTCESLNTSQSSVSFGNCSSFLLFAMPVEFQPTHTQYSATNSGMHYISDAPFLSGSTFCSGLSYKLQLPQPPQIPVTPHISVKPLCFKLVQNLECQSGYGTQLFVCLLLAITAMHCLLSNVLKCFFKYIFCPHV